MSSLRREAVRVVVPASSANLGPAFDSAGLALAVYDEYVAMATDDEGLLIEVEGEGRGTVPLDESHLVARSMVAGFEWLGVPAPGFILRCINRIPHGRGLGSSASAIVGGIVLARAMVDDGPERMTDSDVLQLALLEEDHPDNLSAALHGGFTIAWLEADGFGDHIRLEPHADVRPVVLVPGFEVPTKAARAVLPAAVPFTDAALNVSRAALLVHAMTADPRRLMSATEDRLHQGARASCYPDSVALLSRLRDAGIPAVISGAGPSVLAFASDAQIAVISAVVGDSEWKVERVEVALEGAREVPLTPMT
ncbi:MAG: homoserine kinase [Actinobacteria bacterium]|nr:homoserine kinase [Actinomycetota bacterium]